MVEVLLWIIGFYLFSALSVYTYAVAKTYETLGFWSFRITKNYIGVCEYPKWLLGWVYLIVRKFK